MLLFWDIKKHPLDFPGVVRRIRAAGFQWLFSLHRGSAAAFASLCGGIPQRYGYNSGMQFCCKTTHWEGLHLLGMDFMRQGDCTADSLKKCYIIRGLNVANYLSFSYSNFRLFILIHCNCFSRDLEKGHGLI
jgi:hypothetical protein